MLVGADTHGKIEFFTKDNMHDSTENAQPERHYMF